MSALDTENTAANEVVYDGPGAAVATPAAGAISPPVPPARKFREDYWERDGNSWIRYHHVPRKC